MDIRSETGIVLHFHEVEEAKTHWVWFLTLGVVMSLLGLLAIGSSVTMTLFSVVVAGIVLAIAGIVQIAHAIWARKWKGFVLPALLGVSYLVIGLLCVAHPAASAIAVTLLIGAFCLTAGLFRMGLSVYLRYAAWGWTFFNGLVTFILGLLIVSEWPVSGLWVIGLFIGVDILLAGLSLIALSLSARKMTV